MKNVRIRHQNAIANVGEHQGYIGISVLYGNTIVQLDSGQTYEARSVTMFYRPDATELETLNHGGSIVLEIINAKVPPHRLWVLPKDDVPDADALN